MVDSTMLRPLQGKPAFGLLLQGERCRRGAESSHGAWDLSPDRCAGSLTSRGFAQPLPQDATNRLSCVSIMSPLAGWVAFPAISSPFWKVFTHL